MAWAAAQPFTGVGVAIGTVRLDGEVDGVLAVRLDQGLVTGLYYVRNPDKLAIVPADLHRL